MSNLNVNGQEIPLDKEGYLRNLNDWNRDVAEELARTEEIELSSAHWEVIELLQEFYRQFELSPAMRPLVKFIGQRLGPEKGRSIYLMQLFPPAPPRLPVRSPGCPNPPTVSRMGA